jgi:hypothetical protein
LLSPGPEPTNRLIFLPGWAALSALGCFFLPDAAPAGADLVTVTDGGGLQDVLFGGIVLDYRSYDDPGVPPPHINDPGAWTLGCLNGPSAVRGYRVARRNPVTSLDDFTVPLLVP